MTLADYLIGRLPRLCAGGPFDFARHTSIGCGGTAAAWACPKSGEELSSLLALLKEQNIPYCFLGAGANVLPRDGVFDGVVIRFCGFCSLAAEGAWVRVGAGVTGGRLLRFAKEKCLAGAEFLTGIPMTVGGAVAMNAGVRERLETCDIPKSLRGLPITLIAASLVSVSFLGFQGLVEGLLG